MIRQYLKRFFICIAGLALFGLGNFFGVKAGVAGTNAWNTLALGMVKAWDIGFGAATFLISLAIIAIDLAGRGRLGFGTVLNVVLIPLFSDFYLAVLDIVPAAAGDVSGAVYTLLGQAIISFATILYMKPALGCGPRDTLMIIIGKQFPRAPIGTVKFLMEAMALAAGFAMGAPLGIGTLLVMLLQAAIFQFACRIFSYEPRSVEHEDLAVTCRRMFSRK